MANKTASKSANHGAQSRLAAAQAVHAVLDQGMALPDALASHSQALDSRDQALVQALAYGVCRWQPRLDYQLSQLLDRPLAKPARVVHALLLVGLYQLAETRIPPHAAISATVAAAKLIHAKKFPGLVNAILRRAQREADELQRKTAAQPVAEHAHPAWLLKQLQADWPEHWPAIVQANNQQAAMVLRVNLQQQSRADYLAQLTAADIRAVADPHSSSGLLLAEPCPVQGLPGWDAGAVSVQDSSAQLAADYLELAPGQRVLDACAAPGGKTAHILEAMPELAALCALDISAARLARVAENLNRLQLNNPSQVQITAADAAEPDSWWDGQAFQRILLDAPCSGLGVVRRHPDIKLLRRASDIAKLQEQQFKLLRALWPLLATDGYLLYVTCSVLRAENEQSINRFLATQADAKAVALLPDHARDFPGLAAGPGWQILPSAAGGDGFFYTKLQKVSASD